MGDGCWQSKWQRKPCREQVHPVEEEEEEERESNARTRRSESIERVPSAESPVSFLLKLPPPG